MKNDELKEVYYKLYQQLFLYALSLTKNKADAEDLVSNAFVKAILSFDHGDIKPWLYKVLKNEFYNYRKRKKRIIEDYEFERVSDNKDLLKDIIKEEFTQADVTITTNGGLCSYYAEVGGILVGFEL